MSINQVTQSDYCPNCNSARTGNFCANCGQKMDVHRENFWRMLVHFAAHYFHYDSKFWTTLKYLLFFPGKLTRLYFEGKQASFINPIQLYIFVSAIFFLVFLGSVHFYINPDGNLNSAHMYLGKEKYTEFIPADFNCDSLQREHDSFLYIMKYEDSVQRSMKNKFNRDYLTSRIASNLSRYSLEHSLYSDGAISIAMMNLFIKSISKMFFVLLPWFAFLLWVFFSRHGKYLYVDHAVFALHFHAFTFISAMLGILIKYANVDATVSVIFLVLIPCVYFLIAIHNFYKRTWLYTIGVGGLVGMLYVVSLLFAAFISVMLVLLFV